MNALDEVLVSVMLADGDSGGLNEPENGATGGFHQLVAPQSAGFPRCRFQELDRQALYSFRSRVANHLFYQMMFDAVDHPTLGSGVDIAGRLKERAIDLFTDPQGLTVEGHTLLYSRFRGDVPPQALRDEGDDRYVYSKGMVLEIWLT
jgi:hypothetical protein